MDCLPTCVRKFYGISAWTQATVTRELGGADILAHQLDIDLLDFLGARKGQDNLAGDDSVLCGRL